MSIFDKIGGALEDVKDAFIEQAPTILPIALNILAPGMGTITASALGAGIGSLLRGDDIDDAVRNAAIGGATGAAYRGLQGGIGGIREDITQGGQFFRDPLSSRQYAPSVGGSFGDGEFKELAGELIESQIPPEEMSSVDLAVEQARGNIPYGEAETVTEIAELTEPSIFRPFQGSPDIDTIIQSPEYAGLKAEFGGKKALEIMQEKYTPSMLQRAALPLAGITALTMGSGPEEEYYEEPMTGEDLFLENPELYMVNIDRPEYERASSVVPYSQYYERPMFAEKGGAAVPSKYRGFSRLPEAVQQNIDPELANKYKKGGKAFPRRNGGIGPGEGSGTKDDVPAMLMDGEFVMTRDAVKGVGGGDLNRGIQEMYNMMDRFERMA
jgi:hypothetical protein